MYASPTARWLHVLLCACYTTPQKQKSPGLPRMGLGCIGPIGNYQGWSALQDLMPKKEYKGQKLIMLVTNSTIDPPATMYPGRPSTVFVRYKPNNTMDMAILINRSPGLMFLFIVGIILNVAVSNKLLTPGKLLIAEKVWTICLINSKLFSTHFSESDLNHFVEKKYLNDSTEDRSIVPPLPLFPTHIVWRRLVVPCQTPHRSWSWAGWWLL